MASITYVLTNNPKVRTAWSDRVNLTFVDGGLKDVLDTARNAIHDGAILLSHPLSSSLKPGETPYKSLLLEQRSADKVDIDSLSLIEEAIHALEKFEVRYAKRRPLYTDKVHRDFQMIDLSVINSALESAGYTPEALEKY